MSPRQDVVSLVAPRISALSKAGPNVRSSGSVLHSSCEVEPSEQPTGHFWSRHFQGEETVPWERFQAVMMGEFEAMPGMQRLLRRREWLCGLVHSHVFMGTDPTMANFEVFRGEDSSGPTFVQRIKDLATAEVAIEELLQVEGRKSHMTTKQRLDVILGLQVLPRPPL